MKVGASQLCMNDMFAVCSKQGLFKLCYVPCLCNIACATASSFDDHILQDQARLTILLQFP